MPIRRRRLKRNFTIWPNQILQDARFGSDEFALMIYLLSRPANWKVVPHDLGRSMKWGRDKTYAVLRRLIEFGYIHRTQDRDVWSQSFGEVEYTVYSNPDDNPHSHLKIEGPLTEAPRPENTDHLIRTDRNQEYKTRTIKSTALLAPSIPTISVVSRNPLRDRLAELLYPGDASTGYEMLSEGAALEELLRKLRAGTLVDDDLMPTRHAYLDRGRRSVK